MESIINKLYYGELSPCSLPTPTTTKYFKAKEEVDRFCKELLKKLPDGKELVEKYTDAILVTEAFESEQSFER